jgi:O-antigen/teichoic acid export membrane protein
MSLRELARGAAGSFALNACAKVLMLAASVLAARLLGPEGFGAYAAAVALALVLGVLAGLGLQTLLVRQVAAYGAHGDWGRMHGLLRASGRAVAIVSVPLAAAATAIAWFAAPAHAATLAWALALVPLVALNGLRSGALRGLRRVGLAQVPECLVIPAGFLAALLLFELRDWPLSSASATALRLAVTVLGLVAGAWFLLRSVPLAVRIAEPRYERKAWAASAGPLFVIGLLSIVNLQADLLLVAALRGPESAGVYQAAARGAELVAFSLLVANFALQPMISRLHALGDTAGLQRAATFTARLALGAALPLALVLAAFGGPILGVVFGAPFERGALCLAILCAGQAVSAALGSVDHLLSMTGHERDAALGLALGAAANVALGLVLIPRWDIEGAALATAASLILWNVALSWRVRVRLGITAGAGHAA